MRRIGYAEAMSTAAVFIALGGSGYAVSKISGGDISDRSISGKKLKKKAVTKTEIRTRGLTVPRALSADRVPHLLVPSSESSMPGRRVLGAGSCGTGPLIKLSVGETCVLDQNPPFSLTVTCTDMGDGAYRAAVAVSATEDGWIGGPGPQVQHAAGEQITHAALRSTEPVGQGFTGPVLATPSGAALNVSPISLGVHLLSDCWASFYAVGGT